MAKETKHFVYGCNCNGGVGGCRCGAGGISQEEADRLNAKQPTEPSAREDGHVECCDICNFPKDRPFSVAGDEKTQGWPKCVNPNCPAYGEPKCSASFFPPDSRIEISITEYIKQREAYATYKLHRVAAEVGEEAAEKIKNCDNWTKDTYASIIASTIERKAEQ